MKVEKNNPREGNNNPHRTLQRIKALGKGVGVVAAMSRLRAATKQPVN